MNERRQVYESNIKNLFVQVRSRGDALYISNTNIGGAEFCYVEVTSLFTSETLYSDEVWSGAGYLFSLNLKNENYFIKLCPNKCAMFLIEKKQSKRKPLTLAQRNKKKMSFRRSKMKRKISMERNRKKLATKEKLQTRTDKKARMRVIGKLFPALAKKPRSEWSNSDKKRAEQIIIDNQSKIKKFAKIMYKDVRKAEVARLAKYRENRAKIT